MSASVALAQATVLEAQNELKPYLEMKRRKPSLPEASGSLWKTDRDKLRDMLNKALLSIKRFQQEKKQLELASTSESKNGSTSMCPGARRKCTQTEKKQLILQQEVVSFSLHVDLERKINCFYKDTT